MPHICVGDLAIIGSVFIQENAYENVVCGMAAILSQPQCVKGTHVTGSSDNEALKI